MKRIGVMALCLITFFSLIACGSVQEESHANTDNEINETGFSSEAQTLTESLPVQDRSSEPEHQQSKNTEESFDDDAPETPAMGPTTSSSSSMSRPSTGYLSIIENGLIQSMMIDVLDGSENNKTTIELDKQQSCTFIDGFTFSRFNFVGECEIFSSATPRIELYFVDESIVYTLFIYEGLDQAMLRVDSYYEAYNLQTGTWDAASTYVELFRAGNEMGEAVAPPMGVGD